MISFVVPVYNTASFLESCINSILDIKLEKEIIIIDDGSTDGSGQLCDLIAQKHSYIRVIHQINQGASVARNAGILASRGDYIHFVDSDDLLVETDNYIRSVKPFIESGLDILCARLIAYNHDCTSMEEEQKPYPVVGNITSDIVPTIVNEHFELTLTCPVNKVFRRELIMDHSVLFTPGLQHEEDEWLPKVFSHAEGVMITDDVIYKVRRRAGSLSNMLDEDTIERKAESKMVIASSGMDYMICQGVSEDYRRAFADHYWGYMIDSVLAIRLLHNDQLKKKLTQCIKDRKRFFDYRIYLSNCNWRIMGAIFKYCGIKAGIAVLLLRYKA